MAKYNFLNPFKLENKGITLKNRVVIPPMTERMAMEDGTVSKDELDYYQQRAGQAGMFISAVANVNPLGKGFEGELSIADDKFVPRLSELAAAMKTGGSKAIIQIFSAGRMSSSAILRGEQPISASAIAAPRPGHETPRALEEVEVLQTIKDFGEATRRAIEAGFDGVEIHGANTYLIQQFFSPHSNRRDDSWGGSVEKRMKFPLAVIDAVQDAIDKYSTAPFILGYRLSPEELEEPGITLADTMKLIDALKQKPLDYLHVSQNDVWRTSIRNHEDKRIINSLIKKQVAGAFPIIVVGSLATPKQVEKAAEDYDLLAIGHEMIWEPKWVSKVANGDEDSIRYSINKSELADLNIQPSFLGMIEMVSGGPQGVPLTGNQKE
ncbi:NADH-dependent flavin oxidoreductase [Lentilactobacillus curieae]|uniref:NADH-dependent flavin oxidoreductase n=1 Tax=Lentilactobacillus curieae TaxID=1138822 RepID=A0A1S6QGC3_9LACO|nr:NADH-dependent flavin oxidoreductase [Lentilactobacillus curieae]AQW20652.1 NADH-dependent flavin oxidoreductase [Lentilactobacillus curieae]